MTKLSLLAVAVLTAALSSPVLAQTAPTAGQTAEYAAMTQRYLNAKWTYTPANPKVDLYPERAANAEVSGMAQIACYINPDGHLSRCVVLQESPTGYDFGKATAAAYVSSMSVDPATVDGGIQSGDFKIFTHNWVLN